MTAPFQLFVIRQNTIGLPAPMVMHVNIEYMKFFHCCQLITALYNMQNRIVYYTPLQVFLEN